jgi:anthranilate phosphoribosyltransferase
LNIQEAIAVIIEGQNLTEAQTTAVMRTIMEGETTPAQIGSFLTALRIKGETVAEVTGCARAMREKAAPLKIASTDLVDTCGTGGDGAHTFNISTIAALVAAGAGLRIAKHGNRSVSSLCGSADLLQELGVRIDLEPAQVAQCIAEVGMGFLFAPVFHPAMRHAAGPRREIGIRSIFNLLGPLTNPAGAAAQVVGVYQKGLTKTVADVLGRLGCRHVLAVHGEDGLDEITITNTTQVSEFANSRLRTYQLNPVNLGLPHRSPSEIQGGDAVENARITHRVLEGEKGARREIVLLNAAATLIAGDRAKDWIDGIELAAHSIDSGAALKKLEALQNFCA